ncbi:MAG: hypothetical protein IPH00_13255 [Flavobacteriales bacterium]|nr:hypothetical protein [Flavobacteriales bacterium]
MVKKLPLFSAMVAGALGLTAMAQCPPENLVTIYSTDFETDNGGLIPVAGVDWEYGDIPAIIAGANCESAAFSSPGGAYSGTKGWATLLNDCYHNQTPSGFNTLEFTVNLSDVDYLSAQLEFAHWFEVFTNFDYLLITANGTEVFRNDTLEDSNIWLQTTVDLSPFLGQSAVTLAFKLWATTVVNRAGWYIDDVNVTACSSIVQSVAEGGSVGFRAWPVPATDKLQIEPSTTMGTVQAWTLYDATGRNLAQGIPAAADRFNIDVSAFQGMGVLELRTAQGTFRQQVVMQ